MMLNLEKRGYPGVHITIRIFGYIWLSLLLGISYNPPLLIVVVPVIDPDVWNFE